MGWSSGTTLVCKLIAAIQSKVEDSAVRRELYVDLIEAFEEADWDNIDEAMGEDPAFDAAVKQLYPEWEED